MARRKNICIKNIPPSATEFIAMRMHCGWGEISLITAKKSLSSSVINACIYCDAELAGFGRVVGDGILYFYIQDMIIKEQYRGQGLGGLLMAHLLGKVKEYAQTGASIGLMSAAGKEEFYKSFGFEVRPSGRFGAGMTLDI